ncbi:acyl-CoA dehydrogenase family protein [Phaeodactylibacter luteus]|uniref:Acyl-CoA dehydrogenase n=1 Tax=Phaeodactylibacter luteus TaxID=1564516 RepID=A0A5C6RKS2_9BACT|nr:acyl-CoA dehydrogenase family protein [Phaeodactylibacter luteus]TXB62978.1 acyl-CoA dehydrogenase [Phaeodactylibacter luteus]
MDLTPSEKGQELQAQARAFVKEKVIPLEGELLLKAHKAHLSPNWQEWEVHPKIEALKKEAQSIGLWNLFLPDIGISNLDYAPIAEETGRSLLAPELFNCNAPDSGNMEVLWKYASEEQKDAWLKPLLAGEIRSAFCMTEPYVASSDATNMQATITSDGEEVVLNGRKWWSTGIGHPNCKVLIFMGLSDPEADRHRRHSMVLVPLAAKGVKVERMLPVFGTYDPPYGHGEVSFDQVRLPKSAVIAGLGKGFEIAQGRLGPGRVHHCMRLIGAAERALEMMVRRGLERTAFGKPLAKLGGNLDVIAKARMHIDMARLLVMKTAWLLDNKGIRGALSEVSQIKAIVPEIACKVIDDAIQMHGGMGLSQDTALAALYNYARVMRLADGPDEVHRAQVAYYELKKFKP